MPDENWKAPFKLSRAVLRAIHYAEATPIQVGALFYGVCKQCWVRVVETKGIFSVFEWENICSAVAPEHGFVCVCVCSDISGWLKIQLNAIFQFSLLSFRQIFRFGCGNWYFSVTVGIASETLNDWADEEAGLEAVQRVLDSLDDVHALQDPYADPDVLHAMLKDNKLHALLQVSSKQTHSPRVLVDKLFMAHCHRVLATPWTTSKAEKWKNHHQKRSTK